MKNHRDMVIQHKNPFPIRNSIIKRKVMVVQLAYTIFRVKGQLLNDNKFLDDCKTDPQTIKNIKSLVKKTKRKQI